MFPACRQNFAEVASNMQNVEHANCKVSIVEILSIIETGHRTLNHRNGQYFKSEISQGKLFNLAMG
jgi:hypothetical protein